MRTKSHLPSSFTAFGALAALLALSTKWLKLWWPCCTKPSALEPRSSNTSTPLTWYTSSARNCMFFLSSQPHASHDHY